MQLAGFTSEVDAIRTLIVREELAKLRNRGLQHPQAIDELVARLKVLAGMKRRTTPTTLATAHVPLCTYSVDVNNDNNNFRVIDAEYDSDCDSVDSTFHTLSMNATATMDDDVASAHSGTSRQTSPKKKKRKDVTALATSFNPFLSGATSSVTSLAQTVNSKNYISHSFPQNQPHPSNPLIQQHFENLQSTLQHQQQQPNYLHEIPTNVQHGHQHLIQQTDSIHATNSIYYSLSESNDTSVGNNNDSVTSSSNYSNTTNNNNDNDNDNNSNNNLNVNNENNPIGNLSDSHDIATQRKRMLSSPSFESPMSKKHKAFANSSSSGNSNSNNNNRNV